MFMFMIKHLTCKNVFLPDESKQSPATTAFVQPKPGSHLQGEMLVAL